MILNCDQTFLSAQSLALPDLPFQEGAGSEQLRKINSCFKTKFSAVFLIQQFPAMCCASAESNTVVTDTFLF